VGLGGQGPPDKTPSIAVACGVAAEIAKKSSR